MRSVLNTPALKEPDLTNCPDNYKLAESFRTKAPTSIHMELHT